MSNEELINLIRGGRRELMGELYMRNIGFIQGIIRRGGLYPDKRPEDYEDAMQDAYFGLFEAAMRFDESKGYKFLTYAEWYIRRAVNQRHCMPVSIPEHIRQKAGKIKRIRDELTQQLDRRPTAAEISRHAGIDAERVTYLLNVIKPVQSMSEPVQGADDLTVGDCIEDERICFEEDIAAADERHYIREVISELPERERKAIEMNYFQGMTRTAIAAAEGVSIEMVRHRINKGLRRLRCPQYSRRLLDIDEQTPFYNHVGVNRFNNTWISSTEKAVLIRERLRRKL